MPLAGDVGHATRQREQQNEGRADEGDQKSRFEGESEAREVEAERRLPDAEPVHRHWNHLDDEGNRDDHRQLGERIGIRKLWAMAR